jgi:hypothetical protein
VVGDELEATHQRVSPAKYLAAQQRFCRSVVSLACSTSSPATRARSQASSVWGDSGLRGRVGPGRGCLGLKWAGGQRPVSSGLLPGAVDEVPRRRVVPDPAVRSHVHSPNRCRLTASGL